MIIHYFYVVASDKDKFRDRYVFLRRDGDLTPFVKLVQQNLAASVTEDRIVHIQTINTNQVFYEGKAFPAPEVEKTAAAEETPSHILFGAIPFKCKGGASHIEEGVLPPGVTTHILTEGNTAYLMNIDNQPVWLLRYASDAPDRFYNASTNTWHIELLEALLVGRLTCLLSGQSNEQLVRSLVDKLLGRA